MRARGAVLAWGLVLPGLLALAACVTTPSAEERHALALRLAAEQGWRPTLIDAGAFALFSLQPERAAPVRTLTVYIEGDGLAWINRSTPSTNPTPRNPLALQLALAHPLGAAAYLARPCQYQATSGLGRPRCDERYWTVARFAPEVIVATGRALDSLKASARAENLVLVGYSGGAAVAALVAATRTDVRELLTVAGNLDHARWTAYHGVPPLQASLNAADAAGRLATLPQRHWVGADDAVVPAQLAAQLPPEMRGPGDANLRIHPGFTHDCCWVRAWPQLILR